MLIAVKKLLRSIHESHELDTTKGSCEIWFWIFGQNYHFSDEMSLLTISKCYCEGGECTKRYVCVFTKKRAYEFLIQGFVMYFFKVSSFCLAYFEAYIHCYANTDGKVVVALLHLPSGFQPYRFEMERLTHSSSQPKRCKKNHGDSLSCLYTTLIFDRFFHMYFHIYRNSVQSLCVHQKML